MWDLKKNHTNITIDKRKEGNYMEYVKLTLAEHSIVYAGLKALSKSDDSVFDTFCAGAANWFKKKGFTVTKHGIGYRISI